MRFEDYIRDVPNFPKQGVLFKDITPLLKDAEAFEEAVWEMLGDWEDTITGIAALDSRGFIFGAAMAVLAEVPFVPVRKKGKLPYKTHMITYDLEYGTDTLEIHTDAFNEKDKVLIVDDLLATGGTAEAAACLIEKTGAEVLGFSFLIELAALNGAAKLAPRPYTTVLKY